MNVLSEKQWQEQRRRKERTARTVRVFVLLPVALCVISAVCAFGFWWQH